MKVFKLISDILMEVEFRGLTPVECLLKVFKENKEFERKKEEEEETCQH